MNLKEELEKLSDKKYKEFSQKLISTKYFVYGVRSCDIKKLAKTAEDFGLNENSSYEEIAIKGMIIGRNKTFDKNAILDYIAYIDNWGINDSFVPCLKFKKDDEFYNFLIELLQRPPTKENEYYVRFAVVALKSYYTPSRCQDFLPIMAKIRSDCYYINMGIAWCFCESLIKCYDIALKELTNLEDWVRNKAIQKSVESFRLTNEQKDHLRTLKVTKAR